MEIGELAGAVEAQLERRGLALTMGGEPTFIPHVADAPEWNQQALGPEKLGYARRLAGRLVRELYPGALVMEVHGKRYPGEDVPRWVVSVLRRDDGAPLWRHPEKLVLDVEAGPNAPEHCRGIVAALAGELGLSGHALPCAEGDALAGEPIGWALPLEWADGRWRSDDWPFSDTEPVPVLPGDAPLGLRLPLSELDSRHLRRALTLEVVEGALHLFIPPLDFEPFVSLIDVVERLAVRNGLEGLVLCGYRPEAGGTITALGLAADPGVLEVNLPPTRTWREYDRVLRQITSAAEREGLQTTRLSLNGQVQGTGGGAHVIFGGPTLEDNPFFQRPDLLASMVRYWQRHPALSYFFSGQYVGPGSQAPRADEAQSGRLYELETACLGLESVEGVPDRVFLDRLFRNLMTDCAGNTHRAEICLDKLWNFDSPTGLQGLVELRAFETMSDVGHQSLSALFVRAVVAMLAAEPCTRPLTRWGSHLHDACMLPTVLWQDLVEICADLASAGLPFEPAWLHPVWEHRFAVLGRLNLEGNDVVIRQALDPWPLMAELADGGATSRVVDNSTDRIEISAPRAVLGTDYDVTVDDIVLVMREVGDRAVAGVRYKSASGWPALHPHLPSQSPLRIELIDHSQGVVSSAQYHFWNPEGPRYAGPPRDPEEARARRRARWRLLQDRVGAKPALRAAQHFEESHYTLDLRRQ